jgi:hypothetical protein
MIPAGQLTRRHHRQQLTSRNTPIPHLDRPDRRVQMVAVADALSVRLL